MTARPRQPRRQGVVYGPRSYRDQREPGSIVGRLLGGVVIFGALAVLAVGVLAVIGDNANATPTPSPTLAAQASPTPSTSILPTLQPTASPTASPTPLTLPSSTPSPTPFLVELVEGPGKITFASNYNSNLVLIDPRVDFALGDEMAWRANIGQPVGAVRVDFDVYRVEPATGGETVVHSASFIGQNPDARFYYAKAPVQREVDGPGIFVMRYSVDGTTISEGYFRVSP